MLVESVLTIARPRLVVVSDGSPVKEAAIPLGKPGVRLVVVCNPSGRMVGVMSKTDIVKHISHCHGHACTISISEVMTREVVACSPKDWLHDAWSIMKTRVLACVPIVAPDWTPLGVLYAWDALQALLKEVEDEEGLLRDYVMSVGYH